MRYLQKGKTGHASPWKVARPAEDQADKNDQCGGTPLLL
jgi:hypothetical protein